MKQSNHKLLFKIFKPLLLKVMTPIITKVIEKVIKEKINQLDGVLYSYYQEANRLAEDAKNDPEHAQNIFQRYATAVQNKITAKKEKAQQTAAKAGEVNVAMTQQDSIFPNIRLPGGISTKATEYKELAQRGDKWESPVFSIGSAKETSGLKMLGKANRRNRTGNNTLGSTTGNMTSGQNVPGYGSGTGATGTGYDGTGYDNLGSGSGVTGAGYGSGTTGAGYGSSTGTTGAGYGTSTGVTGAGYGAGEPGYGATGSQGYSTGTGAGTGLPTRSAETQGFSNQVDQAFGEGERERTAAPATTANGGTLLGSHNPVFTGEA